MGTRTRRTAGCLFATLAIELSSPSAHAQASSNDEARTFTTDETKAREAAAEKAAEDTMTGLGTALNFRGAPDDFTTDFAVSGGANRLAVEALRLSARVVVLPDFAKASELWAGFVGLRVAGLHYATFPASGDDVSFFGLVPANLEPTFGFVVESPADEVRFEADVAPVLSLSVMSQIASQAAGYAAAAMGPHDDLLFLPNTQGGARLRLALTRRLRLSPTAFLAVGAEVETGYARVETLVGPSEGSTGGGALSLQLYRRTPGKLVEGTGFLLLADVGLTAAWAGNVVLPLLFSLGPTVEISRNVQARLLFGASTPNPAGNLVSHSFLFDSWGATLGFQWAFGGAGTDWARPQVQVEPELLEPEPP